jgi:membrane-associated protease RseP (regulator of RpoE activity)
VEHPLFHAALAACTFLTTTVAGALMTTGTLTRASLTTGLSFSIPVMLILGTHEMGHFLMCRKYGVPATYPYFLPSPLGFGTFGALIRIKAPIRDKRILLDVGAAGPLAGFIVTLPFLLYGVARPRPSTTALAPGTMLFDYPLLVRWAQRWTHVEPYTSASVHEHPTFMAAWFGLLVTAMNLLPLGQLDGSHVLRALLGKRQPWAAGAVVVLAIAASVAGSPLWLVFSILVVALTGFSHPPVDNDDEPLDFGRALVALLCVAVFLLCVSLTPIRVL